MNYWVISDTHFGHTKMGEYCGRPKDFERILFRNLSHFLHKDDVIIHLGDVCFGHDELYNKIFTAYCRSWLIRGNHDHKTNTWYLNNGWDVVCDTMTLNMFGKDITLSHAPMKVNGINVHGHLHAVGHHPEVITYDNCVLVAVEHDYKPVKLKHLVGM